MEIWGGWGGDVCDDNDNDNDNDNDDRAGVSVNQLWLADNYPDSLQLRLNSRPLRGSTHLKPSSLKVLGVA